MLTKMQQNQVWRKPNPDPAAKEGELRGQGIEAKSVVESGPVVSVILDVAEREKADLVAMASHGRTGLSRFYGSVAAGAFSTKRIDRCF